MIWYKNECWFCGSHVGVKWCIHVSILYGAVYWIWVHINLQGSETHEETRYFLHETAQKYIGVSETRWHLIAPRFPQSKGKEPCGRFLGIQQNSRWSWMEIWNIMTHNLRLFKYIRTCFKPYSPCLTWSKHRRAAKGCQRSLSFSVQEPKLTNDWTCNKTEQAIELKPITAESPTQVLKKVVLNANHMMFHWGTHHSCSRFNTTLPSVCSFPVMKRGFPVPESCLLSQLQHVLEKKHHGGEAWRETTNRFGLAKQFTIFHRLTEP